MNSSTPVNTVAITMCPKPPTPSKKQLPLNKPTRFVRRVHFADEPSQVEVVERRSQEEREQSFYTTRELKMCQLGRRASVEAARADVFDERFHCLRGVEQFVSFRLQKNLKGEKKMLYDLILTEQERQKLAGIKDDTLIREVSEMCSVYARNRALDAAAHDAAFVSSQTKRKRTSDVSVKTEELCPNRVMEEALAVLSPFSKDVCSAKLDLLGKIPVDFPLKRRIVDDERPLKRHRMDMRGPALSMALETALSA